MGLRRLLPGIWCGQLTMFPQPRGLYTDWSVAEEQAALLRELAAIKRHDPNRGRDGYTSKVLTLNVPVELLARLDEATKGTP